MNCPYCDTTLMPGTTVCPGCGATIAPCAENTASVPYSSAASDLQKKRFCTKCGRALHTGAAFCSSCGAPVGESSKAQQSSGISPRPPYAQPQQNVPQGPVPAPPYDTHRRNTIAQSTPDPKWQNVPQKGPYTASAAFPPQSAATRRRSPWLLITILAAALVLGVVFLPPAIRSLKSAAPGEKEEGGGAEIVPTQPGKKDNNKEKSTAAIGPMRKNTLTQDRASVSFGADETGEAVLLRDPFGTEGPDDTAELYDLGFSAWPVGPITVEFDAPELDDGCGYLIQLGIPVRDADGNEGFEWVPLQTEQQGGKARAELMLDGIDEYLESISYDGVGETAAIWTNNIVEFGGTVATAMLGTQAVATEWYVGAVVVSLSDEYTLSSGAHFLLHIPNCYIDKTEKDVDLPYPSDLKRFAADMEKVYDKYAAEYDVSARTTWPMHIYFTNIWDIQDAIGWSYVACFAMPKFSVGGRIGIKAIDFASMKINQMYLRGGYGRPESTSTVELYAAFAHEMFHFVQRCYISTAKTQRWFDESSAAYYDSYYSELAGHLILELNYRAAWWDQFSMMTFNPTSFIGQQYGRMPVFCFMMQRRGDFLKRAYDYLRETGGYNSWQTVYESAAGTTMAPLARKYFQALVTKGSLYAMNNTPWDIYNGTVNPAEDRKANDEAAWKLLRYNEALGGSEQTGIYSFDYFSARFVILDTKALPETDISLHVALTTPGVDGTLYKIEGDSYDKVTYSEIPTEKETSMFVKKGDRLLLMLVNETDSSVNAAVTYRVDGGDITPFLGEWRQMFIKDSYDYCFVFQEHSFSTYILNLEDNSKESVMVYDYVSYTVNGDLFTYVYIDSKGNRKDHSLRMIDENHLQGDSAVLTRVSPAQ